MMRARLALAAVLLLAGRDAAAEPAGAARPVARFAIVIGNNHSERPDTRDLRYADDDAVAMHELLAQAGVRSALFASLDAESRPLYPGLAVDGRPRWRSLRPRLARLEEEIRAAARAGAATALLVFYSGHGDVAHGEGYVELEDARLTRSLLRREILDRTAADEVHLVVDACRSFFLAFEKGPGGERRRAAAPLVSQGRARTGYILSTSSDRESHEWEAFQGGIFSHEVRSALRGAADADRDGSVTYAELGAFLSVANRGIRNPRFRPEFVVRPPRVLSDELLRWDRGAQALLIDLPGQGHMVMEGPDGERVLDVNPAAGQELLLRLPPARPLFLRRGDGREFAIAKAAGAPLRLSALSAQPVRIASKGALQIAFRQLFSSPFGAADVARYRERVAAAQAAERASIPLVAERSRSPRAAARRLAGVIAIATGAIGVGLAGWAIERSAAARDVDQVRRREINGTVEDARLAAGIALGVAASSAVAWWLLGEREQQPLIVAPVTDGAAVGIAITRSW